MRITTPLPVRRAGRPGGPLRGHPVADRHPPALSHRPGEYAGFNLFADLAGGNGGIQSLVREFAQVGGLLDGRPVFPVGLICREPVDLPDLRYPRPLPAYRRQWNECHRSEASSRPRKEYREPTHRTAYTGDKPALVTRPAPMVG